MGSLFRKRILVATLASTGLAFVTQAHARPPTVVNSPGYERALKESRANYLRAAGSEAVKPVPAKKKSKRKPKK